MSGHQIHVEQDPEADVHNPHHLKVGTLTYTAAGLITLFVFLLWGDFCFTLMETVVPSILPRKLHAIGASDLVLGLIVTVIPNILNTAINPIVSFRSDRFRSRWGRRIPFLACATPFLVIFLILLGYSGQVSDGIRPFIPQGWFSGTMLLTVVIGVFMVCFQFFNLFITSVYYYLFNDVVPHAFLARFMALFRIVGSGAGVTYNLYIFPHADTHMKEIFLGAALFYLVAFVFMCWRVREGDYPPPPSNVDNQTGFVAAFKTYAKECFTHRIYWFLFLANSCVAMTWASGTYGSLVGTEYMGFSLDFLGKVGAACGTVGLILLYPAGMIADRFHPLRVLLAMTVLQLLIAPFSITFIFTRHHFSLETAQWIQIALSAIGLPMATLYGASELPTLMKIFPQERYGQFCSANALVRSCALIIAGFACGGMLGFVQHLSPNPNDRYRFVSVWNTTFHFGSAIFLFCVYREWKRFGGLHGYAPPCAAPAQPATEIPGALEGVSRAGVTGLEL